MAAEGRDHVVAKQLGPAQHRTECPNRTFIHRRLGRHNLQSVRRKDMKSGDRVEEIENSLTQKARYLDKLVDEQAKGRKMEKILRVE